MMKSGSHVSLAKKACLAILALVLSLGLVQTTLADGEVWLSKPNGDRERLYRASYALLIGVSDYKHWTPLTAVPGEHQRLRSALEDHGFEVETLNDPNVSELRNGVQEFIARYGHVEKNRLLIFFSGHGHSWGQRGYVVPRDAPEPIQKTGHPGRSFLAKVLPIKQFMFWAEEITAHHAMFVFDSCFSGSVFLTRSGTRSAAVLAQAQEPVRAFITAGKAGETVPAESVFVPEFIKALRGDADRNGDRYVTGGELGVFLRNRVPARSPLPQTPMVGTHPRFSEGEFVFALAPKPVAQSALAASEIRDLQRMLSDLGYEPGGIDGTFGLRTRSALNAFERDNGLPASTQFRPPVVDRIVEKHAAWLSERASADGSSSDPNGPLIEPTVGSENVTDAIPEMVKIPSGSFRMGDLQGVGADNETPVRAVWVRSFRLSRHEVTVGQFERFVAATGYRTDAEEGGGCWEYESGDLKKLSGASWRMPGFEQTSRHPVVCVSIKDVDAYIVWLNRTQGPRYRLPSESEWEYAARAGSISAWQWGEQKEGGCRYVNGADESLKIEHSDWSFGINYCLDRWAHTALVGSYAPNSLGLVDTVGNVSEWTADCWHDSYMGAPILSSAWREPDRGDCSRRVIRGGSWASGPRELRSSSRGKDDTRGRSATVGFRVAQDN